MAEETLPFFAILMPIMMAMGFDSITAFMTVFVGARIGYIASTVNPFNVLIAQGILGIQGNPQLWLRMIALVVLTTIGVAWVMVYALKVKKNPESSLAYHDDIKKREEFAPTGTFSKVSSPAGRRPSWPSLCSASLQSSGDS